MNDELTKGRRARRGVSRRRLLAGAAVAPTLLAGRAEASADIFAGVELPPEIGQTELQVYVPETGHTVRGTMLDYWRANGAAAVFGNPLSEPFPSRDGYYSQAFERAVLQYRPEFLFTDEPIVRLMPIHGAVASNGRTGLKRDGRRRGGGGDARLPLWRSVSPDGPSARRAVESGGVYFEETGHTVVGDLLAWYDDHEGHFYLGHPVSQAYRDRGGRSQLFEGGLLRSTDSQTRLEPLDRAILERLGVDVKPVEQGDIPTYDEALLQVDPNPNPEGDPAAAGRRWIEVSLAQQQLWAYQGDEVIASTLVSTGLDPNVTEQGVFHIRLKYPEQDMQGFTDATGEVLGTGEAPDGTIPYAVEDVPDVMYFNLDAEALHGTYWHDNFGNPMSHGCVNLPLAPAAFIYGWAPLGTMVWVHA